MSTAVKETMEDYVRWRGDLSFAAAPFGLLDSMVLCELSYVDYTKVLPQNDRRGMSLAECGRRIEAAGTYELRNLYGGHEDFFSACCRSRRFGGILLRNYEDVFDEEEQVQFSAVEFVLDSLTSYIAFRGTDNSIVGWKEDFMISFTRIRAQAYARQYLGKVFQRWHSYYIGGHSKGGNLALFASAWLNEKQLKQVIRIYDFDGPGFCPENFDLKKFEPLKKKVTRVIPEFCVIGKVFEVTFPDTRIIRSREMGVNQHDIISWLIDGLEPQTAEKNDRISEWMDKTIAEWVQGATFEERKTFVNEFFGSLAAGGATTMQEIASRGLPEVIKSMAAASPTSKKMVADLAAAAFLGEKKAKS